MFDNWHTTFDPRMTFDPRWHLTPGWHLTLMTFDPRWHLGVKCYPGVKYSMSVVEHLAWQSTFTSACYNVLLYPRWRTAGSISGPYNPFTFVLYSLIQPPPSPSLLFCLSLSLMGAYWEQGSPFSKFCISQERYGKFPTLYLNSPNQ